MPSGIESRRPHVPFLSERASTAQTDESPRLPTKTTPSPMVTELGPTTRLRPRASTSAVGKPESWVTLPLAVSTTSTAPVLPAGTHTKPVWGSNAT
ncbi:MAG: hypothetical protein DMF80_18525 [Acidobacteria bacterium]|nr:MAG: hypothetical protein DMF80_18525 [Acidobacteriota bacterium]